MMTEEMMVKFYVEMLNGNVCTLATAKKLRELGVVQDSMFYHFPNPNTDEIKLKYNVSDYNVVYGNKAPHENIRETIRELALNGLLRNTFSAFTSSELGSLLPGLIEAYHLNDKGDPENRQWELFCGKDDDGWFCGYFNATIHNAGKFLYQIYGVNEADSRAMMVIHLIKNKFIEL